MDPASDPSVAHLLARLAALEVAVTAAAAARRRDDPRPADPFRGLYVSDEDVDRALEAPVARVVDGARRDELRAGAERDADLAEQAGHDLRLRRLERAAGLTPLDLELLLLAAAPDLDVRFERLFAYLADDVGRRRVLLGLALELCGASPLDATARARLAPGAPLVDLGLVRVQDDERPFLSRALHVPDRVVMHLLGDDTPDVALRGLLADPPAALEGDDEAVARAIAEGALLVYVRERGTASGPALGGSALTRLGLGTVALDLRRLAPSADVPALGVVAEREARLRGAGIVAGPVEAVLERRGDELRAFVDRPWPVVLHGARQWDPAWASTVPLVVDLSPPDQAARQAVWRAVLNGAAGEVDLAAHTAGFRLSAEQIRRAALHAEQQATYEGHPLRHDDLLAGARAQSTGGLDALAHHIEPRAGWDDLVLPATQLTMLHELADRIRLRSEVLDGWGMARSGRRGDGVSALFAGPSGTGKTLAAEVVAREIGFDLYVVDLATVVDKYIGETEKNLRRLFRAAETTSSVLFFDEADALFGKRSEVRDAHDRYANVEVAYLLQQMEACDGVVILATNLRSNIDGAFSRRLDAVVDFPMPDVEQRGRLWDHCLGPGVPRGSLDLEFCASAFELPGGAIRNIALAAAYFAARQGRRVETEDLIRATEREYRKTGRLALECDFGPYFPLIAS